MRWTGAPPKPIVVTLFPCDVWLFEKPSQAVWFFAACAPTNLDRPHKARDAVAWQTLKEELVKTQHEITDRIVTLHTIEKEWDAMGLFTMVPNGPKGEEDLSAARLERLRAMARTRRDTARSELGPKLQDAEGLWEMLKRPLQVRDKWRKMVKVRPRSSYISLEN